MLVLFPFVFSIAAFAVDGTVSFSANVTNSCEMVVTDPHGSLLQLDSTSLLSDITDVASVVLSCPLAANISISLPSVNAGMLTDSGGSVCFFFDDSDSITGGSTAPFSTTGAISNTTINITVSWVNTTPILDGSYVIDCTITATPS